MAERVTLVSDVWPALHMSLAFQVSRRSITVSTRGWRSVFFSLCTSRQGQTQQSGKTEAKTSPVHGDTLYLLCVLDLRPRPGPVAPSLGLPLHLGECPGTDTGIVSADVFYTDKNRVIKIVRFSFEIVLRTTKHKMIYHASGYSLEIIAIRAAV
jgi:hypothetical protein